MTDEAGQPPAARRPARRRPAAAPTPREIAEAVWLWRYLDQPVPGPARALATSGGSSGEISDGSTQPDDGSPAGDASAQETDASGLGQAGQAGPQMGGNRQPRHGSATGPEAAAPERSAPAGQPGWAGLAIGDGEDADEDAAIAAAGSGLLLSGAPPALPAGTWPSVLAGRDPRAVRAALRPLRQTMASACADVLDEEATAERLAQGLLGLPVYRPARERRFEIVLIVDGSPSMTPWLDTVPGIVTLLERHGAFRDVQLRFLNTDTDRPEDLCLRTGWPGGAAHAAAELLEPTGRRILWVLTDALGRAWWTDAMSPLLWSWARRLPVALLNLVPRRLWQLTGLRPQRVRMSMPGGAPIAAAPRWAFRDPWGAPLSGFGTADLAVAVPVPVLEAHARRLAPWAGFLSGRQPWTELTAVLTGPRSQPSERAAYSWGGSPAESATECVQRFRAVASQEAFELATHLAAAPLTWAVLRMVRDMVPGAGRPQLSEIFAGGLVRPVPAGGGPAGPERIALEFHPGVRAELLAFGRRSDATRVLRAVSDLLGSRVAVLRDTGRMLDEPDSAPVPVITGDNRPFLLIEKTVLGALSGRYLERSRALATRIQSASNTGSIADSVQDVTMSDSIGASTPLPRSQFPVGPAVPAHPADSTADRQEGGYVPSITATSAVERQRTGRSPAVWGNVPPRNPHFTGRRELLAELHKRLHEGTTAVLPEALHGMGGVGKSQLAVEYVYRHQADYDVIWWIPAEWTAQIGSALVDLAQRLRLPVGMEANIAIPNVLEALRTGEPYNRWLLVFDNAEDPKAVREFFPAGGDGRVLVTSRNMQWANVARPLEVDVFARTESIELLQRRGPDLTSIDAGLLAEALGDLPLAIEQAATWRAETGMPAQEYLRLFEEKLSELLNSNAPMDYEKPVAAAWNVSLDRLANSNPAALRLLQVCAFFAPEPISRQLLAGAGNILIVPELDAALRDSIKLNQAIREINRYALARIDHRTNSLQMHRLVQAVLIGRMTPDERETMRHGAHALLAGGNPHDPVNPENWNRYAELYPHVLAADAVGSDNTWLRELLIDEAEYLYYWGDHQASCRLAEETHRAWRRLRGDDDPHTIEIAGWLAWMFFVVGRYQEAAEVNARLLDICNRLFGPDHEKTVETLGAVAAGKRVEGDFRTAMEISDEVYRRASHTLGIDDPVTLTAAHNVGVSLRLLGEFARARDLDEDTWQRRVRLFGEDELRSLISWNAMTIDERELGDYLGARARQEELLERFRRLLHNAESHPQILRASRNLAVARRKAGDHTHALELSRDVQLRLTSRYGPDHPDTLAASLCLSMDLRHNGDLAGARELCEQTRERYQRVLGEEHPHTLAAAVNLAITHRLAGDVETAYEIDRESFEVFRRSLGSDHPSTLACAVNLASELYAQGEFQAAHDRDVDILARSKQTSGEDHPATLVCSANLAMDLRALGRMEEAGRLHASTITQMDQTLGVEHPATRAAAGWVRSNCDIDPLPL
ncbi:FxSxx-COOH system tetratricopeptide repeat protein [Frankia sp. CIT1]|uniref:FxSxx-COOH system tetratricopeptide repeat protein n=1 Tax=Frankia sp. CIT1 TaxID=2880974 RepID=UPI001EF6761C|nr:FxSxx-COOH system tetratricopeptide repeat protein [Frankia sp. CIT1]